ncbi:MAG: radical SAM protein [Candidatus Omnitrophica bacterium]|nr:radical SAM protein [Candidatus Omnitrophota bacterium]
MKVLFLNPPFENKKYSRASRSPAVTRSGTLYYPFYLSYAAGVLEQEKGIDVFMIDAIAEGYNEASLIQKIKNISPSLVICDTSTPSIYNDVRICELIKNTLPHVVVFLVGTHPSALPEETLSLSRLIDGIARKEYDYTIRDIALFLRDGKDWHQVDGISYRDGMNFVNTKNREFINDLDSLPFVAKVYKQKLNIYRYFFAAGRYPMVMMVTGRGCPFQCRWCLYPQTMYGHKYRLRSPENVFAELEYITKELPQVKEIGFEDDTFTADLDRCEKICDLIMKNKLRIRWWANARADLPLEIMKKMKSAGCRLLITGFESGSQRILDNVSKKIKIEDSYLFAKNARRVGLLVHGCFVLGNIGETKEDILETINFALSLPIDTAQFFPMIAYPGTYVYQWAVDNNCLITKDFRKWLTPEGLHASVIDLPGLQSWEVMQFCNMARKKFYTRPVYLLNKIWQSIFSFQEAKRNFKTFSSFKKYVFGKEGK